MKKFRILTALFVLGSLVACEQNDANIDNVYDNSGQTGVGFTTASTSDVSTNTHCTLSGSTAQVG